MARLQILELPSGVDDDRPPFVLVVDETSYPDAEVHLAAETWWRQFASDIGARGCIVTDDTFDIPANDLSAYREAVVDGENGSPDFTSPIAGRIEVRQPCPYCGDRQMIPRSQYAEHVVRLHPLEPGSNA
ncbi:hypothetical protein [Streptomyces flavofungini]|uniref:hypothetical protein n=1 Tax=Streptomyces flavofungini TaxID=68200 RepID=UPI0034DE6CFF